MLLQHRVAAFKEIDEHFTFPKISIVCNVVHAELETVPKKAPRYRKVGRPTKDLLV